MAECRDGPGRLQNCSKIGRGDAGMKQERYPTVLPLAAEGWSSIHSVLNEDDFWNSIEKLRHAGAEGVLVVPIEKMIR